MRIAEEPEREVRRRLARSGNKKDASCAEFNLYTKPTAG
jgi:hypothetical protein